jgi:hypothetical protein
VATDTGCGAAPVGIHEKRRHCQLNDWYPVIPIQNPPYWAIVRVFSVKESLPDSTQPSQKKADLRSSQGYWKKR